MHSADLTRYFGMSVLDDPGGPTLITWALNKSRTLLAAGRSDGRGRRALGEKNSLGVKTGGHEPGWGRLEKPRRAGGRQQGARPHTCTRPSFQKGSRPLLLSQPRETLSNFWPTELRQNKRVLLQSAKFVWLLRQQQETNVFHKQVISGQKI